MKFHIVCYTALLLSSAAFAQTTKTFEVDFATTQERIKDLGGVNAGPEVLSPRGVTTTPPAAIQGYKDGGVTLIRVHDISGSQYFDYTRNFWATGANPSVNATFDPNLTSNYIWTSLDNKIDSIVNFGFTPYFRLGVNFGSTFPYPPVDANKSSFSKFASVCAYTVRHYNEGWSSGRRYGIKYWEVWNEPDSPGFWKDSATARGVGDSAAFVRMYKTVSDSLKRLDATLKVGAAGILSGTVLSKRGWERYFITACRDNRAALDFFSWHLYGALNPYTIAVYGAYMRGLLDAAGFTSAENHVSETNIRLGEDDARFPAAAQLINKPKHAAYMASQLISAQMGSIDRLMVYRGTTLMNLFNSDTLGGQPNLMLSGRGFKAFTELTRFAPQRIKAEGSEFIATEASATKDTTNIMVLAGRADIQNTCYVLVSNYNSRYSTITANIKNLPWKAGSGSLTLKRFQMNASGVTSETVEVLQPSSSLALNVANMTAPAVALLRLQFTPQTAVQESPAEQVRFSVAPNPSLGLAMVKFTLLKAERVRLALYNVLGREVAVMLDTEMGSGDHAVPLALPSGSLPSGAYRLQLRHGENAQSVLIHLVR